MPIKLPKGFQRRKSSGQALEEVLNPPQSSFRVLERTPDSTKSFDGGNVARRTNEVRPVSEGQYLDYQEGRFRPNVSPYNRGSGGTQNSASSGVYDTASSARFSSSSTLPSSSSISIQDDSTNPHPKPINTSVLPAPTAPSPKFLRAAGRTFSFGVKKATETSSPRANDIRLPHHSTDFSDIPDVLPQLRQRAMTETSHASGSTATPPKLTDADMGWQLSLGNSGEDDFGNMFDSMSNPEQAKSIGGRGSLGPGQFNLPTDEKPPKLPSYAPPPPPVHIDRNKNITPAPWSATSRTSQDRLITESPRLEEDSRQYVYGHKRYSSSYLKSRNLTGSPGVSSSLMSAYDSPKFQAQDDHRMSTPILDDDAKAVLGYLNSGPRSPGYAPVPTSAPTPPLHTESPSAIDQPDHGLRRKPVTLYDGYNQDNDSIQNSRQNSLTTTPKALRIRSEESENEADDDLSFQEMARSAARIEAGETPSKQDAQRPSLGKKVMSGAEFERYKKEQELYRSTGDDSESEKSETNSVEDYDEDDEEQSKQITQQRRKQEAKMSVYRQQMMKITGERSLPSEQPGSSRVSGLTTKLSTTNLKDKPTSNKNSDDEDDDIPLGILAAHGFPSKERAPSHLARTSSSPNIRYQSETYPPPVPPMPNQSGQNLPVFARNLPQDPYFGAGLVNQAVREPLGYSSATTPGSVYGGSQSGGSAVPPGGLVGVIAKEERARALRRGSPNHNSTAFELSNATAGLPLPQGMMPGAPQLLSPESQAQMQMNQQMTQMMQMQMQWMQQMMQMQMQGGNAMPQMPMMPMMPSMPGMPPMTPQHQQQQSHSGPTKPIVISQNQFLGVPSANNLRPPSTASQFNPMQGDWRQSHASSLNRTSTAPSFLNHGLSQGYAPSIAPSERSNIGQPSRYRPVSNMAQDGRASTMGTHVAQNWNSQSQSSRPGTSSGFGAVARENKKPAVATVRPVVRDEEDDEEGWEEMRRERESKKKLWRRRQSQSDSRPTSGSQDVKGVKGLEGVFYPTELA